MNFSLFLTELWNARLSLLSGLGDTILISVASVILGSVLGVFVGLAMTYGAKWLRFVVRLYIDFLRGTPVFVLILACFYILSVVGLDLTAFQAGVLALTLFCSSHVGEIVRGALSAIPQGQTEAAKSVGLTFGQTFVYVLLPQALRQILPTWVNTATEIVKASTLLSIIGVVELLLATQQVISRTYLSLEFYLFAGFVYFLLNFVIEQAGRAVERRISIP
ncbi:MULTISPECIES: amino acid ABC transporter permease [Thalassospira]|jgi:polar amino acid transport system permease protein|uniref:ABC transporter permease n=2 Tax=Thalassospira tepidiphila TaxID=393657 RepID=A0A853KWU4_9PROT|nr:MULTISPECIES: amino acid ABC transporter permease [Thalassospira]KXJ52557.1 MAG: ABC transporter permease [Thalassospira sp. Nap_22]MBO6580101.1 amino acid ABC transporter permease [Thalassospira sp.]MBO6802945.1 amino acid ABC transporter permease [Thalassospira sp.]MBO6819935.1 amino acid ABC transporter permease [Thalassospira sp.]MBO6889135.1 amino acid ABC transporter permease [Thalassospira sp.]|tara:strand:- start:1458 stop:2117 length:660 start_codon:yes stop_codon:yes gene_type:complete